MKLLIRNVFSLDSCIRNDKRGAIYDVMYKIIIFQSQLREAL